MTRATLRSNTPEGFLGFQTHIEQITEALGGSEGVRVVVEDDFARFLRDAIKSRLYGTTYGGPSGRYFGIWTAATDDDFKRARVVAVTAFRRRIETDPDQEWESTSLAAKIVLRDDSVYLEGGEHGMFIAHAWPDTHAQARLHPTQTTRRDPWHIHMSDSGKTVLQAIKKAPSRLAVAAQGRDGAIRSLVRFAELFV